MNKSSGYKNEIPVIREVHFVGDKIIIDLLDGRTLSLPLSRFPDIQKLTAAQKRKHKILAGMGLMFNDIDTVYHVSDFLGSYESHKYSFRAKKSKKIHSAVAEPATKYKVKR